MLGQRECLVRLAIDRGTSARCAEALVIGIAVSAPLGISGTQRAPRTHKEKDTMTTRNGTTSTIGSSVDERIDSIKDQAAALKGRVIEVKDQAMDRGNAVLDKSTDF